MNRRGQSTVEPMLAVTSVVLALVLAGYLFPADFQALVAAIAEWVATKVPIP